MDLLTRSLMMTAGGLAFDTTVEFVASSNKQVFTSATTGTDTTITLSGLQADDVVFLAYTSGLRNAVAVEADSTDLSSATWTTVDATNVNRPGAGIWYTISTGTSVSVDVEYVPINDGNEYVLCLYAFRGCNTTTPIHGGAASPRLLGSNIDLVDIDYPPSFDTYAVGYATIDDDINVTLSMPEGYTEIFQGESSGVTGDTATMAIAYGPLYADTAITGKTFTASSSDSTRSYHFFLVPEDKESAAVITGSSSLVAASGSTTVATYTADKTVTWSLEGTDASLFSISSGGVVTYNSSSVPGIYDITVKASNVDGLVSILPVSVTAYSSGGTAGGGITLVTSTSGTTDSAINDPLTLSLSGLQSGDVVFFVYSADSFNSTFVEGDGVTETLAGYTRVALAYTSSSPANRLYYKVVTSTSESLEFNGQTTSFRCAVGLFAFRGVDNTDPILDLGDDASSTAIPDHFILDDAVEIVVAALDDDGGQTSTPPTGYTEIIDQNVQTTNASASCATIHVSSKDVNGNTTESSRSVTFTSSDSTRGYSFTLRPD